MLNNSGEFQRIVSIQRNDFLTAAEGFRRQPPEPVIADMHDNIRTGESVKSYQIVRSGLEEDVAVLRRPQSSVERNRPRRAASVLARRRLRNAIQRRQVHADSAAESPVVETCHTVCISRQQHGSSRLGEEGFRGYRDRHWLGRRQDGVAPWPCVADGAGNSIDFPFSVWRRDVKKSETVTLGSVNPPKLGTRSYGFNMYGIAAVAAD